MYLFLPENNLLFYLGVLNFKDFISLFLALTQTQYASMNCQCCVSLRVWNMMTCFLSFHNTLNCHAYKTSNKQQIDPAISDQYSLMLTLTVVVQPLIRSENTK